MGASPGSWVRPILASSPSRLPLVMGSIGGRSRQVTQRWGRSPHGRWHSLHLRPYKTLGNKIGGVVMVLCDVDLAKRAQAYTASIVSTVREPLLVLDNDLRVQTASRSFYETFRFTPEETENQISATACGTSPICAVSWAAGRKGDADGGPDGLGA